MPKIKESELILNDDGSVYHLNLKPGDLAKDIITVGDPERAKQITKRFDKILFKKSKREFTTITGTIGKKNLSVISTGIGTDNIDIVFNEIDALFNIGFKTRQIKSRLTKLNFYRIGTSGSIQKHIPIDSFLVSQGAIGLDGLGQFYQIKNSKAIQNTIDKSAHSELFTNAYLVNGSSALMKRFSGNQFQKGITITAAGFYNPQGRQLRLKSSFSRKLRKALDNGSLNPKITNLEMETAGIYLLSKALGHQAISINAILANRATGHFSAKAAKTVNQLIDTALEIISR